MLVYGDGQRTAATADVLVELAAGIARLPGLAAGLEWHGAFVTLFIDLTGLLQGVADAEFALCGHDAPSPARDALTATLVGWAEAVDRSWRSGWAEQRVPPLPRAWPALPMMVTIRRCEGYAFYALYPEAVAAAARALSADTLVIGLRSIGTGLAAMAAAACATRAVLTVRPVGHPYARTLAIGPALAAQVRAHRGPIALVDEGPGRSGSSFGGAADWLEAHGVARDHIVFLPSHGGDLGPEAAPAHRARWGAAQKLPASFEALIAERPLASWFADLTGPAIAPLRDISGGAWRDGRDVPADPARESRKYLLTTGSGRHLLKFAGLDRIAAAKLPRARALYAAGFTAEPLALRHGFLLERWLEGEAGSPDPDTLACYLRLRAGFAAGRAGASLAELAAMARYNLGAGLGRDPAVLLPEWPHERLAALQPQVRPVHVDGRMQRWEWLRTADGWRKADALDHAEAHDLVGCQDIAWDVAGAIAEHDLALPERQALTAAVLGDRPGTAELLDLMLPCYLGFQIGWWSFAADPAAHAHRDRLVAKARVLLC